MIERSSITISDELGVIQNTHKNSSSFSENIKYFSKVLAELTKIKITFFVSVTTFVGYILHHGSINLNFFLSTIGVLILASGASALNEFQESNIDSKMERTKERPIPSGKITAYKALLISFVLILAGTLLLALNNLTVLTLGLFTLVWYNGIYTPLKKKSSLAIIPGALVGALPPIIGWAASGGSIWDIKILTFALFMFIWQIPHFWLLLLMYDDQYKEAGFPTLSNIFSFNLITKITFAWIIILVATSGLFYFAELSVSLLSNAIIAISGLTTIYFSIKVITDKRKEIFKKAFLIINAYVLSVLIVISVESII